MNRARRASASAIGYSGSSSRVAAGYQRAASDGRWKIGGGLQYDAGSLGQTGASAHSMRPVRAPSMRMLRGTRKHSTRWNPKSASRRYALHSATLRPALDLSVTQFTGNTQSNLTGSLAGVAPFALTDRLDRTLFKIAPSLTVSRHNWFHFSVGAHYDVSAGAHTFNAFVQFLSYVAEKPSRPMLIVTVRALEFVSSMS
ncbi:MAG: hypothetical protein NVSMB64_26630 [Candidatus Velthaea sp.]